MRQKVSTSAPCFDVVREEVTIAPFSRQRCDSEKGATANSCFCVHCTRYKVPGGKPTQHES